MDGRRFRIPLSEIEVPLYIRYFENATPIRPPLVPTRQRSYEDPRPHGLSHVCCIQSILVFTLEESPPDIGAKVNARYRSKGNGSNSHPKAGLSWPSLPIGGESSAAMQQREKQYSYQHGHVCTQQETYG